MSAKSIIKAESALKMEQLKAQSGEYTFRVRVVDSFWTYVVARTDC